ncbi:hypothetical protein SEA_FORZA_184 [Gordonia phage Forza]|uniref:Uncharacterized protein n=1 Tax=Gordonia phage Forza TaxID=2571247 RepID=A0A650EZK4_9CAUD|nr:hypothetical protein PP303_gp144 [Gordonia phage Forza]QEM41620.1 hypothetical protein SEA_BOOPY_184 [Gordonia phage Boopy]QGT55145.1 hypothetical protein SEA_FORZA_184 [Gordonia phage Forza]UXE04293.1 helix-turn-helix DNA binding domain protein [Gordonia phage BlueNGold]WBF03934.1 hypothetical protein SEA_MAREELIH_181 [Gordonia phage Mareelih]
MSELTAAEIEAEFGIPLRTINDSSLPRTRRNGRNYFDRVDVQAYSVQRESRMYRREA